MNKKQRRVLQSIFFDPIQATIKWEDVESLFRALGAVLTEGGGSGIRVELNGVRWRFDRPHPENIAGRGRIKNVRTFLTTAGVTNDDSG